MLSLEKLFKLLLDKYGAQNWWPADTKDEVIIGALLTQNTNWQNVVKAIDNLKSENLCNLKALKQANKQYLAQLIRPSGYYNIKADRLINIANILYNKDLAALEVDAARKFLLSIKGVGGETADSILLYAYNLRSFVIDSYTRRFTDRLFPNNNLNSYEGYQQFFMNRLPQDTAFYNEYHALIVKHCKNYCRKQPRCEDCLLSGSECRHR